MAKLFIAVYVVLSSILLIVLLSKNHLVNEFFSGKNESPYTETSVYKDHVFFQKRIDSQVNENSTIFFGDSHIQGLNLANITEMSVNFGIGRETTAGLLNRIKHYESIKRVTRIVVLIGVNDLISDQGHVLDELFEYLNNFSGATTKIFFIEVPFVAQGYPDSALLNNKIAELNKTLYQLCREYPEEKFSFLTNGLNSKASYLLDNFHVGDNLHLNAEGAAVLSTSIKSMIKP